ncbi:hypothetical protein [Nannocystis sp. SCPEA4]|uniref:hypothetical protein n=1 Tax=Nannocystis sp. SCPEA4 TaxID=2996787 RepID=UPI0022717216|nr:hypothetical protein [Nannocystis sp. SCPEA4]
MRHWLEVLAEAGLPHLQPEAKQLLDNGARPEDYEICVRSAECHLKGVDIPLTTRERKRLYGAPDALRIAVLYWVGETAPPPTYLGTGSGWSWSDDDYTAWSPGSGVDPDVDRRVRRSWRPQDPPFQLELDLAEG